MGPAPGGATAWGAAVVAASGEASVPKEGGAYLLCQGWDERFGRKLGRPLAVLVRPSLDHEHAAPRDEEHARGHVAGHKNELRGEVDFWLEGGRDGGDDVAIGRREEWTAPDQSPVHQAAHVASELRGKRRHELLGLMIAVAAPPVLVVGRHALADARPEAATRHGCVHVGHALRL